jgi:hypothetical protein
VERDQDDSPDFEEWDDFNIEEYRIDESYGEDYGSYDPLNPDSDDFELDTDRVQ